MLTRNINMVWRRGYFWALEASLSNEVEDRRLGVGNDEIAMCIHPRLQPLIYDKGSLAVNKVQWIKFNGLEGRHVGIVNVYASNLVGERCAMWNETLQSLLIDCRWIMTGDFIVVDDPLDRSTSSCSRLMGIREELAWVVIKNK